MTEAKVLYYKKKLLFERYFVFVFKLHQLVNSAYSDNKQSYSRMNKNFKQIIIY